MEGPAPLSPDERRLREQERKKRAEEKEKQAEAQRVRDEVAEAEKLSQAFNDLDVQKALYETKIEQQSKRIAELEKKSDDLQKVRALFFLLFFCVPPRSIHACKKNM
jgi:hypothetical protein